MTKVRRVAAFMALVGSIFLGRAASAITYDIDETDLGAFGTLCQTQVGPSCSTWNTIWGENWDYSCGCLPNDCQNNYCAPTATMNSFIFLQNAYPTIYGDKLYVPGTNKYGYNTDGAILAGPSYMNTNQISGTTNTNWIDGKVNYINHYAPGTTYFEGMDSLGNGGQSWVQVAKPTANFLVQLLQQGEDVEIGLVSSSGVGHVMTLSSIDWNTASNCLTIDGIDPAAGVEFDDTLNITLNGLVFGNCYGCGNNCNGNYGSGCGCGNYNGYTIVAALGESPILIPEPATLGLLLVGGGAIAARRIRRKTA